MSSLLHLLSERVYHVSLFRCEAFSRILNVLMRNNRVQRGTVIAQWHEAIVLQRPRSTYLIQAYSASGVFM